MQPLEPPGWRLIPTETVVELITGAFGTFPPSIDELESLARRHEYGVVFLPPSVSAQSRTQHSIRMIYIAHGTPERMQADMLHEMSEVLLRLPVAAEYHYPRTGQDEHHVVSVLATDALLARIREDQERIVAERSLLLAEEVEVEQSMMGILQTIDRLSAEMGKALAGGIPGVLALEIPDPALMHEQTGALRVQRERLQAIKKRLLEIARRLN